MKLTAILPVLILLLATGCSSQSTRDAAAKQASHADKAGAVYASDNTGGEGQMSLDEAIRKRRSTRSFSNAPLSDDQFHALAWAAQGITDPERGLRAAPSAGAKYPLELYFITEDGVRHYIPAKDKFEHLIDGDLRSRVAKIASDQKWMADAALLVVFAADVGRTAEKYDDRAERYVLIEIGHAAQNLLLEAVSLGLVGGPVGAFYDDQLANLLELPDEYHAYYIVCIGYPEGKETVARADTKIASANATKPRINERQDERDKMVREMNDTSIRTPIKDERVNQAMRDVPRHLFVPDALKLSAYSDTPLPIGYGQTISQPYVVGLMTELLELQPGDKVLEIGTGSGYQAAVLSEITPNVFTIEIIRELADQSAKTLKEIGYNTIHVRAADGYFGWKEEAPFDGIIVTCAAGHIPPPLLKQLKPGGRMVIPIGGPFETQRLVVVTKDETGKIKTTDHSPVVFVPMTGRAEE